MNSLFRRYLFLTVVSILFLASAALAQTVTMTLTGVNDGANAGGVYVDPYQATIASGPISISTPVICDDWSDETDINETWTANVQNLSSLGGTIGTTPIFGNNSALYNEAAWLATKLLALPTSGPLVTTTTENEQIAISYALWELTCGTTIKNCVNAPFSALQSDSAVLGVSTNTLGGGYQTAWAYYNAALTNGTNTTDTAGWQILTPTNGGPPQEFLVDDKNLPITAPESSPGVLLGADMLGLLGLVFLFRRRLSRPIP